MGYDALVKQLQSTPAFQFCILIRAACAFLSIKCCCPLFSFAIARELILGIQMSFLLFVLPPLYRLEEDIVATSWQVLRPRDHDLHGGPTCQLNTSLLSSFCEMLIFEGGLKSRNGQPPSETQRQIFVCYETPFQVSSLWRTVLQCP